MTTYVDNTFYTDTFKGNKVPAADFDRIALRASAVIDSLTFGRAETDVSYPTEIKMATCAVMDEMYEVTSDSGGGVTSERVGDLAVTYSADSKKTKDPLQRYHEAAALYLARTFLMFPGFNEGEYAD